ncbi:hypothetical protein [Ekhidna sp.]|uniref:hypothetical protein n=1 Tax=Ekhidna sp. TaxID=2608089 RepID=UPI003CCBDE95
MEKLAIGLTLISVGIAIFFIALLKLLGIIDNDDLKQLKNSLFYLIKIKSTKTDNDRLKGSHH